MSVRAEILPPEIEQALLIPRVALDWNANEPRALLADGSAAEVRLGPCNAQECVVEDGLEQGARLRSAG